MMLTNVHQVCAGLRPLKEKVLIAVVYVCCEGELVLNVVVFVVRVNSC